ncbi:MAG TPA: hypothetical protein VF905_05480, partial [Nitrospirota bacterium]
RRVWNISPPVPRSAILRTAPDDPLFWLSQGVAGLSFSKAVCLEAEQSALANCLSGLGECADFGEDACGPWP